MCLGIVLKVRGLQECSCEKGEQNALFLALYYVGIATTKSYFMGAKVGLWDLFS